MHAAAVDFSNQSTLQLLNDYVDVLGTLRKNGVIRSENNPLADYAEGLCARALSLTLVNKDTAGYDATDREGHKIEIKARRLSEKSTSRQLSAIRAIDLKKFDFLAGVLFAHDFTVKRGALIPHAVVKKHGSHQNHVNAWRFMLTDAVWGLDGVVDITDRLNSAQEADRRKAP